MKDIRRKRCYVPRESSNGRLETIEVRGAKRRFSLETVTALLDEIQEVDILGKTIYG